MPQWWDEGRAPYAPNNPFLNVHIIWIAALAPIILGLIAVVLTRVLC